MSNSFLRLDQINKTYGDIQALKDVSLEVQAGELLVVLGPTGAGKTTLLRTIAGLETPDSGRLRVNEQDITDTLPADRDVALVFQNFSLYPNRTVRQNLEFPLRAAGRDISDSEITERVAETAEILRITPLLDRPSPQLSGGEMQRVAIGRAIVRQPQLFLMDEPLTNLDAKLRESLRVELIRLQRELDIPMIYVTHDQVETLSMGDRIAVLSEGQILQIGSPKEIYEQPASPHVAKQLGHPSINLIETKYNEGHWFTDDGTRVCPAKENGSQKAILGIRPENISPTGGAIPATVEIVEDLGPSTILLTYWAGQKIHILVAEKTNWRSGDTIHPQLDPDHLLIWPQ